MKNVDFKHFVTVTDGASEIFCKFAINKCLDLKQKCYTTNAAADSLVWIFYT